MLCDRPTFHIFNSLPISVDGKMSHMAPPTVSANYNNAYFQVRRSPRNKGSALSASLLWTIGFWRMFSGNGTSLKAVVGIRSGHIASVIELLSAPRQLTQNKTCHTQGSSGRTMKGT